MKRPLYEGIWADLIKVKSMIFMSGPRQSGKTTFAKQIAAAFNNQLYFNWDFGEDKRRLIDDPSFFNRLARKDESTPLVVLDEIHKFRKWKNYLKGVYDKFAGEYRFLVLGSGRLDLFQRGGDSLAGRYFQLRFWPFTLAELAAKRIPFKSFMANPLQIALPDKNLDRTWAQLSRLSGFPEPFLSGENSVYRRWADSYRKQLIREDIRDATEIRQIDLVETLFTLLPARAGNPLSFLSLSRDLQVSPNTIQSWIKTLETFYLIFLIPPWTKKLARAITKERKLYLFDYAEIPSPAAKFENMVALELLRATSNWNDLGLGRFDLHYLRNREKEEVDFVVSENREPILLVEAKLSDTNASPTLIKFQTKFNVPAVQLVQTPDTYKILSNGGQKVMVVTASRWLPSLP